MNTKDIDLKPGISATSSKKIRKSRVNFLGNFLSPDFCTGLGPTAFVGFAESTASTAILLLYVPKEISDQES